MVKHLYYETRGQWATSLPEKPIQINKHISEKLEIYQNIDRINQLSLLLLFYFRMEGSLFVKPWVPFTQEELCQVRLKLSQWFWRKTFLNFANTFLLFCYWNPFKKGHGLSFQQTWISFTQKCFVSSLVAIGTVVL